MSHMCLDYSGDLHENFTITIHLGFTKYCDSELTAFTGIRMCGARHQSLVYTFPLCRSNEPVQAERGTTLDWFRASTRSLKPTFIMDANLDNRDTSVQYNSVDWDAFVFTGDFRCHSATGSTYDSWGESVYIDTTTISLVNYLSELDDVAQEMQERRLFVTPLMDKADLIIRRQLLRNEQEQTVHRIMDYDTRKDWLQTEWWKCGFHAGNHFHWSRMAMMAPGIQLQAGDVAGCYINEKKYAKNKYARSKARKKKAIMKEQAYLVGLAQEAVQAQKDRDTLARAKARKALSDKQKEEMKTVMSKRDRIKMNHEKRIRLATGGFTSTDVRDYEKKMADLCKSRKPKQLTQSELAAMEKRRLEQKLRYAEIFGKLESGDVSYPMWGQPSTKANAVDGVDEITEAFSGVSVGDVEPQSWIPQPLMNIVDLRCFEWGQKLGMEFGEKDTKEAIHRVMHCFEKIVLLWESLGDSEAPYRQKLAVFLLFASCHTEQGFLATMSTYVEEVFRPLATDVEAQSGYANMKEAWYAAKTSQNFARFSDAVSVCVAMIMTKCMDIPQGAFDMRKYVSLARVPQSSGIIDLIVDNVTFFLEKSWQCWREKSLDPLFRDETSVSAYDIEYGELRGIYESVESNDLERTAGISMSTYAARLESSLKASKEYVKAMANSADRRVMVERISNLTKMIDKVRRVAMSRNTRIKPFGILITGKSGVGKTTMKGKMIQTVIKSNPMYFSGNPSNICTMNGDDQYQTEMDNSVEVIVLDDLGNTMPDYAKNPATQAVINIFNNEAKAVLKADVESKGKVWYSANLGVVTTNAPYLHSVKTSTAPAAVLRRFEVHVDVSVKERYRVDGGDSLDPAKVDDTLDVWDLRAYEYVVAESSGYERPLGLALPDGSVKPMEAASLTEVCQLITQMSRKHFERQSRLLVAQAELYTEEMCEHDVLSSLCPQCSLEAQSGPIRSISVAAGMWQWRDAAVTRLCAWISAALSCVALLLVGVMDPHVFVLCVTAFTVGVVLSFARKYHTLKAEADFTLASYVERVKKCGCRFAKVTAVAALVIPALMIVRRLRKLRVDLDPQGALLAKPDLTERPVVSCWTIPPKIPPVCDTRLTGMTHEQMVAIIASRICYAEFDGREHANILPVCSNVWIVNNHIMSKGYSSVKVVVNNDHPVGPNFSCKIDSTMYKRIGDSDVGVLYLPKGGSQKDILHFFPETSITSDVTVTLVHKDRTGQITNDKFLARPNHGSVGGDGCGVSMSGHYVNYIMNKDSFKGLCCAVLVADAKRPYIAGVHFAGLKSNPRAGLSQVVTGEEIRAAIGHLLGDKTKPVIPSHSAGEIDVSAPKYGIFQTGKVHPKSSVNYLKAGTLNVHGDHTGPATHYDSKVEKTLICDAVSEVCDHPVEFGKPKNISTYLPKLAELEKVTNTQELPFQDLTWAFRDVVGRIEEFASRHPELIRKVVKLQDDYVLAGADGVRGIDSVNLNSSMGFPVNRPKKHYFTPSDRDVEGITRPLDADPLIWEAVNKMEDDLANGIRVYPVTKAHLKDEPKKLGSEKVRVMYGTPVTFLLLLRRYTLSLSKFYMDNPALFETTVGINVFSAEWDDLARKLTRETNSRTISGDFKSYDSLMSPQEIIAAMAVLIRVCELSGNYDERDYRVLCGIATELAYPTIDFYQTVVELMGCNTSGHSLTIVLNGVVNGLYMRSAYYSIHGGKPPCPFADVVLLRTNGDDNVMSVAKKEKLFNHTSVQAYLGKHGITYTMADKDSESVPFLDLESVEYLKRGFRWDIRKERYMPALAKQSIFKMLQVGIPSKVVRQEDVCADNINGALQEMYYHGEREFSVFREQMREVVNRTGLSAHFWNGEVKTFEECEQFADDQFEGGVQLPDYSQLELQSGDVIYDTLSASGWKSNQTRCSGIGYRDGALFSIRINPGLPEQGRQPRLSPLFRGVFPHTTEIWAHRVDLLCVSEFREVATEQGTRFTSVTNNVSSESGVTQHQTLNFRDGSAQWVSSIDNEFEATRDIAMSADVPLEDFFCRPVLTRTILWDPASAVKFYTSFNPWSDYFGNSRVVNRITNFQLVRANLHVKFLVNGNSFYYGRLMADYAVRPDMDTVTNYTTGITLNPLMGASQRLHIMLDPTESMGGVLKLPMITEYNNLMVPTATWSTQGTVYVREMSKLKHANGSVNPVSINVYVWASDVKLSIPTKENASNIVAQSGEVTDEMKEFLNNNNDTERVTGPENAVQDGRLVVNADEVQEEAFLLNHPDEVTAANVSPVSQHDTGFTQQRDIPADEVIPQSGEYSRGGAISGMMSSMASAAGRLVNMPIIGPYAMATRTIAGAAGSVAQLFGFSRPAQIENQTTIRRFLVGPMSNTDRGDTVTKLTVDSKQELTVDPRTVGLAPVDEMGIAYVASRESWFAQVPWSTGDRVRKLLFTCWVTPMIVNYSNPFYYTTASAFAAIPFTWWHGTMVYRFNIVASAFHRGRLLFVYAPNQQSGTGEENVQYSRVVDLSNERDFTMEVGWAQDRSFLKVGDPGTTPCWSTSPLGSVGEFCNGTISMFVLNDLTSPSDTVNNDITINIFARTGADFKVAVPNERFKTYTYLNTAVPQSGIVPQAGDLQETSPETNAPVKDDVEECVAKCIETDHTLSVYFGEAIPSFRTMLKRYMYHTSFLAQVSASQLWYLSDHDFPVYRGFDVGGRHTAVVSSTNYPANIVSTTLLNYLAPAYVGYRGGIRLKYVVQCDNVAPNGKFSVTRDQLSTSYNTGTLTISTATASQFASSAITPRSFYEGGEVTDLTVSPVLEVELPYYSNTRMSFTRALKNIASTMYSRLCHQLILSRISSNNATLDKYVSVGEDFQLFLFQGQPPFQITPVFTPL